MAISRGAMIGAGIAALVAAVVAWPMIRVALVRRKAGAIEDGDNLYDPATKTYYNKQTGAVVWHP